MPRGKIFISHAATDHAFASRLAKVLEHHGLRVWISHHSIVGSKQWHDEIGKALKQCSWFLVVLSSNSIASKWVKREVVFALSSDRYNERIIPVLLEPCEVEELSWVLPEYQYIDFTDSFEEGCRRLLQIWNIPFNPPEID